VKMLHAKIGELTLANDFCQGRSRRQDCCRAQTMIDRSESQSQSQSLSVTRQTPEWGSAAAASIICPDRPLLRNSRSCC
jgi:hypothetical protein